MVQSRPKAQRPHLQLLPAIAAVLVNRITGTRDAFMFTDQPSDDLAHVAGKISGRRQKDRLPPQVSKILYRLSAGQNLAVQVVR